MNQESLSQCEIDCPFERAMDIIGGKWKSIILYCLIDKKVLRNSELLRLIPTITQKMLTQQLREMEKHQLITRKIYEQIPPKVEYRPTKQGKALLPALEKLHEWAINYTKEISK